MLGVPTAQPSDPSAIARIRHGRCEELVRVRLLRAGVHMRGSFGPKHVWQRVFRHGPSFEGMMLKIAEVSRPRRWAISIHSVDQRRIEVMEAALLKFNRSTSPSSYLSAEKTQM